MFGKGTELLNDFTLSKVQLLKSGAGEFKGKVAFINSFNRYAYITLQKA